MLKNAYFLEKNCKNRLSVGSSAPEPPFMLPSAGGSAPGPSVVTPAFYYDFVELYSTAIHFITLEKKQKIITVNVLLLLLLHFCRCKNIFCSRAQSTLAAPLKIIYSKINSTVI